MDSFFGVIKSLLEGLDIRRRWFAVLGTFLGIVSILLFAEYLTAWNYFRDLERRAALLSQLKSLSEEGIARDSDLYPIYLALVQDLSKRRINPLLLPDVTSVIISSTFLKGLSFAFLFLLFTIAGAFGAFGQNNKLAGVFIFGLISILMWYTGTLIPPILNNFWINVWLFPVLQFVVVVIFVARHQRRKARAN